MTVLPAAGVFAPLNGTNTERAADLNGLLAAVRELMGGEDVSTLTIAGGSATPTRAVHRIDTEAAASQDDLTHLAQTNHPAGRLLLISPANDARDIVVKHAAGGAGQIVLQLAADWRMGSTGMWLLLLREGTQWVEIDRAWGNDKDGYLRAWDLRLQTSDAERALKVLHGDGTWKKPAGSEPFPTPWQSGFADSAVLGPFTHGLGGVPDQVSWQLQRTASGGQHGYSQNDFATPWMGAMASQATGSSSPFAVTSNTYGAHVRANATQAWILIAQNGIAVSRIDGTPANNGIPAKITAAQWQLRALLWRTLTS